MNIKKILILDNGGTVSMKRVEDCLTPVDGKEDILKLIYQIRTPVEISYQRVNSIDSTNMSPPLMKLLFDAIVENYTKYDGFVILTGTDTLGYLASFLSFWLREIHCPVVLTGSQKPLNEMGSDAPGNIYYSILFAREKIPEVTVFFGKKLFRGNRVTKIDSRGFDAFDSPKYPAIGSVDAFNLTIHSPFASLLRPPQQEDFKYAWSDRVTVVKLYPGFNPRLLEILADMGYKGVIIEAFGLGNLPDEGEYSLEPAVRELVNRGLIVAIVSQCLRGAVRVEYETARRFEKLKVIFLRDITTEAAYAKLSWLTGLWEMESENNRHNTSYIIEQMSLSLVGEMSIPPSGGG